MRRCFLHFLCIVTLLSHNFVKCTINENEEPRRTFPFRRAIDGTRGRKYYVAGEDGFFDDRSSRGQYDPYEEETDLSDIRNNVPGEPGVDYPSYTKLPQTGYVCEGHFSGYYADEAAGCQVFHVCNGNILVSSFLCPIGSIFSQKLLTCDWWNKVDCSSTQNYQAPNIASEANDDEFSRKSFEDDRAKSATEGRQSAIPNVEDRQEERRNRVLNYVNFVTERSNDLPIVQDNYSDYPDYTNRYSSRTKVTSAKRNRPNYQNDDYYSQDDENDTHQRHDDINPTIRSRTIGEDRKNDRPIFYRNDYQSSFAPTAPTTTTTIKRYFSSTIPTTYRPFIHRGTSGRDDLESESSDHLYTARGRNEETVKAATPPTFSQPKPNRNPNRINYAKSANFGEEQQYIKQIGKFESNDRKIDSLIPESIDDGRKRFGKVERSNETLASLGAKERAIDEDLDRLEEQITETLSILKIDDENRDPSAYSYRRDDDETLEESSKTNSANSDHSRGIERPADFLQPPSQFRIMVLDKNSTGNSEEFAKPEIFLAMNSRGINRTVGSNANRLVHPIIDKEDVKESRIIRIFANNNATNENSTVDSKKHQINENSNVFSRNLQNSKNSTVDPRNLHNYQNSTVDPRNLHNYQNSTVDLKNLHNYQNSTVDSKNLHVYQNSTADSKNLHDHQNSTVDLTNLHDYQNFTVDSKSLHDYKNSTVDSKNRQDYNNSTTNLRNLQFNTNSTVNSNNLQNIKNSTANWTNSIINPNSTVELKNLPILIETIKSIDLSPNISDYQNIPEMKIVDKKIEERSEFSRSNDSTQNSLKFSEIVSNATLEKVPEKGTILKLDHEIETIPEDSIISESNLAIKTLETKNDENTDFRRVIENHQDILSNEGKIDDAIQLGSSPYQVTLSIDKDADIDPNGDVIRKLIAQQGIDDSIGAADFKSFEIVRSNEPEFSYPNSAHNFPPNNLILKNHESSNDDIYAENYKNFQSDRFQSSNYLRGLVALVNGPNSPRPFSLQNSGNFGIKAATDSIDESFNVGSSIESQSDEKIVIDEATRAPITTTETIVLSTEMAANSKKSRETLDVASSGLSVSNDRGISGRSTPTFGDKLTKTSKGKLIFELPEIKRHQDFESGLTLGESQESISEIDDEVGNLRSNETQEIVEEGKIVVETEFIHSLGFSLNTDAEREEYMDAVMKGLLHDVTATKTTNNETETSTES